MGSTVRRLRALLISSFRWDIGEGRRRRRTARSGSTTTRMHACMQLIDRLYGARVYHARLVTGGHVALQEKSSDGIINWDQSLRSIDREEDEINKLIE